MPPACCGLRITLRVRLFVTITVLLAVLTAAIGVFMIDRARNQIRVEVVSTMNLFWHYLDAELGALRARGGVGYRSGQPLFRLGQLYRVRHLRISYFDEGGRLVEQSLPIGKARVEVPGGFVWLMQATSTPIPDERRKFSLAGVPLGAVSVHADTTYITGQVWLISRGILVALAGFFIVVNVLVWWVVSRGMRPLDRIIDALAEVEHGNLRTRLPTFDLPEMTRVSNGFNHMAERLQGSVDENRRLTRRLIDVQESERRHLARELHDEIGQCVTAIHADAVAIRNVADGASTTNVAGLRDSAEAIVDVAARIKALVRGMLQRLRPATLDSLGLEPALRELAADFLGRNPGVQCELRMSALPDSIGDETRIAAYRMIQECLTNTARHAQARRVHIRVGVHAGGAAVQLRLHYRDDGCGFDVQAESAGFGLIGIRERVEALDGRCIIRSRAGRGTRVLATLPLSTT